MLKKIFVSGLLAVTALVATGCAVEATDETRMTPEELLARDEATKSPQGTSPVQSPGAQPEPSPWHAMIPAAQPEPSPWDPKHVRDLLDALERQKDPQPGGSTDGQFRLRPQELQTLETQR